LPQEAGNQNIPEEQATLQQQVVFKPQHTSVLGENSQVILPGRLHRAQPHKDQAKLDVTKALVIIWMSRRP
jgi:hypothetical protein